jgi:preprotein translocase subunit SecF
MQLSDFYFYEKQILYLEMQMKFFETKRNYFDLQNRNVCTTSKRSDKFASEIIEVKMRQEKWSSTYEYIFHRLKKDKRQKNLYTFISPRHGKKIVQKIQVLVFFCVWGWILFYFILFFNFWNLWEARTSAFLEEWEEKKLFVSRDEFY